MRSLFLIALLSLHPAIVGTSRPAASLTASRIAILPKAEQRIWLEYLQRSERQMQVDKAELALERTGMATPPSLPKEGLGVQSIPLQRDAAFYASPQALAIAETILSFQLPNGAWSKNLDMTEPSRLPGQSWMPNNLSRFLQASADGQPDFEQPVDLDWNYAGTLDNDATTAELHYLARISAAHPRREGDRFRVSFLRGIRYLLKAQYPNGGWPQVYPLEGGYHDAITFYDGAVVKSVELLREASRGEGDYSFVPAHLRPVAAAAATHGISLLLRAQVTVAGKRTVWPQQCDPLTVEPVGGRNFEPAALAAPESSDILLFLMKIEHPSPAVRDAIEAGIVWLRANRINGQAWIEDRMPGQPGRSATTTPHHLEAAPGGPPLWSRFTSLTTGKPIFGDRNKTVHDNVDEISVERRNGYAWYSSVPNQALEAYKDWHPR